MRQIGTCSQLRMAEEISMIKGVKEEERGRWQLNHCSGSALAYEGGGRDTREGG